MTIILPQLQGVLLVFLLTFARAGATHSHWRFRRP